MADTSSKLTLVNLVDMLRHLVRIPSMYSTYRELITKDCFLVPPDGIFEYNNYDELPLLYIWQALAAYYDDQHPDTAPTEELLRHYVKEQLRTGVCTTAELEDYLFDKDPESGLIAYMYDCEDCDLNTRTGTPLCKAFVRERRIVRKLSALKVYNQALVDQDLSEQLKSITEEATYLDGVGAEVKPQSIMPESALIPLPDVDDSDLDAQSTGIPWVDASLGGGTYKGECNGILGATGAGKTTLGAQMALGYIKASAGEDSDLVLYYTYEQSLSSIWYRFISCGCSIDRKSLDLIRCRLKNPSTTPDNCKDYEYKLWPRYREPEMERYQKNQAIYSNRLFIRNMSGVADFGDTEEAKRIKENAGRGGVAEIYADALYMQSYTGKPIRAIFIDYAGLVCQRMLGDRALDDGKLYTALKKFGDDCRMDLAGKLNCTVWIIHQLAGSAVGKGPLYKPSHADADGCKSLVNNFTNCICLGVPDKKERDQGGSCLWACFSKTRNSAGSGADRIVMHDKYFSRLVDVTRSATPNRHDKGFIITKRI